MYVSYNAIKTYMSLVTVRVTSDMYVLIALYDTHILTF
jgi:hypothetical protein